MKVAITGASGLVGGAIVRVLLGAGHSVRALRRSAASKTPSGISSALWNPAQGECGTEALDGVDAIIHLAGENIAQRWTASAKQRISSSRMDGTRALVEAMARAKRRPAVLLSASAVGYYGSRGDDKLTEDSAAGDDFLAGVCAAWENESRAAEQIGVRVARLRMGVVLDRRQGALARMLTPFRLGLGGPLGNGRQWMSWIHRDDLAELFRFVLENEISGAINATAPNPRTNREFTRVLARAVRRPAVLPVPAAALRVIFGEMSAVLLSSQRVEPRAARSAGFQFRFAELDAAFEDLLARS